MAVANRGLCLDGEQEGGDEAVDVVDAGRPGGVFKMVQVSSGEERTERESVGGRQGGRERGRGTTWV